MRDLDKRMPPMCTHSLGGADNEVAAVVSRPNAPAVWRCGEYNGVCGDNLPGSTVRGGDVEGDMMSVCRMLKRYVNRL